MTDFFSSRFTTIQNYLSTQLFPSKDIIQLGSWEYWTTASDPSSSYDLATIIGILILIAVLLAWQWLMKRSPNGREIYEYPINQVSNITIFIVLITAAYFFFRVEQISYLNSRLVVLASISISLVWLGLAIFHALRLSPYKYRQQLEQERFFRYIPKKKRNGRD